MPEVLELWLIRHGQTEANARQEFAGWSDVALTEQGRAEARALRERLEGAGDVAGVWASDLQRAVHTARLAFGEPTIDERLREMNFGELEGRAWQAADAAVRRALLDFGRFDAPGGETAAAFRARLHGFLDELAPGRHLVFTHGGVIRAVTGPLGRDEFPQTGEIAVVDWTARKLLQVVKRTGGPVG